MKRNQKIYNLPQLGSGILMIVALLWLTISSPFVLASQQELAKQGKIVNNSFPGNEEENANPFADTTEEKAPTSGNSFSEEYLHDNHKADYFLFLKSQYHKGENAGTYIAFHGELLVPPPDVA